MQTEYAVVGTSVPRTGLADKVSGAADYTADLKRPGMLYARVLRSPHAHARVVRIDTETAKRLPGVHAILTHHDVPICCRWSRCCGLSVMKWRSLRQKAKPWPRMPCA